MKLKPVYQLLLLLCITLGVYLPSLSAPLNSLDDRKFIEVFLNQNDFSILRHLAPGGAYFYYRPIVTLSFEIDKYLGGFQEPFMHLFNVLLHTSNVVLVWLFARRFRHFVDQPSQLLPFLAALFFAIHPINTEAVNWIMARTDLLAGIFVLSSLLFLLRFLQDRRLLWGIIGAICLFLGALCKETALFMIPGACYLLVCRGAPGPAAWRLRWVLPGLYGCAVAVYLALRSGAFAVDRGLVYTSHVLSQATGGGVAPEAISPEKQFLWFDAIRVFFKASGFYAFKLFQPLPLNFGIIQIDNIFILPGVLLFVVLGIILFRRRPVAWLFLLSASIAVSAICVIFTQVAWTPIAERYMYIPSAPFIVGLVYASSSFVNKFRMQAIAWVMAPVLAASAAYATTARNFVWQDNLTLYQDVVRQSPDFNKAREHLAAALREHGRTEESHKVVLQSPGEAERSYLMNQASAYWLAGDYPEARSLLLGLLEEPGDKEVPVLEMLVKMTSQYAQTVENDKLKREYYLEVLGWLERILARWPNAFNYYRIGRVHLILNNRIQAQHAFAEAAKRFPADSLYKEPAAKLARDLAQ